MDNYDMIFKRKSFHLFRDTGEQMISDEEIKLINQKYQSLQPLDADIKTVIRIVDNEETTCNRGQQLCILFYSEKKEGYKRNIGYLGEQLDLYLTSLNIGTLWYGIGKPKQTECQGMEYVIMMAIKKVDSPSKFRKDMYKAKRKALEDVWKGPSIDQVSDIVRFAPSACNSQPWLVEHKGNKLFVYRNSKAGRVGIIPSGRVAEYNRIDIGIFLCFLDLCLQKQNIKYQRELKTDLNDDTYILNAVYELKGE